MPGELGVYVKALGDGHVFDWHARREWYLASTVKIPIAVSVLEKVEAGELSLKQRVTLREDDFVDGAGDLQRRSPGQTFTVGELIEKSLENSDSIATDMLVRLVGEEEVNRRLQHWTGGRFGQLTTLRGVRYDVYGPLDPRIIHLPGRVFLELRAAGDGEARLSALARSLGVPRAELPTASLDELFERYYDQGKNTARLDVFGELLELLVEGHLLNEAHTQLLLDHMQRTTTGRLRIQAGLPEGVPFAQKTGTQIARACNVGVILPRGAGKPVIVAACAARYQRLDQAERAFQEIGRALTNAGLVQSLG